MLRRLGDDAKSWRGLIGGLRILADRGSPLAYKEVRVSLFDPRVWLAAILALVLAYGGGRLQQRMADNKRHAAEQTAALAKAQEQRIAELAKIRSEEQRRTDEQRKIADDATKKADSARADAVAANDAASRLRQRVAELLAASRTGKDPKPAGASETADPAANMLGELFLRSVETNRQLAEYADQARIAGEMCERAYESLERVTH